MTGNAHELGWEKLRQLDTEMSEGLAFAGEAAPDLLASFVERGFLHA